MNIITKKKYTILSSILKYSFVLVLGFAFIFPVLAQDCTGKDEQGNLIPAGCTVPAVVNQPGRGGDGTPAVVNPGSTKDTVKVDTGIQNPIAGIDDIPALIETILNWVLVVGVPIVTLAIIYSGFLFVTAQGNSEKLTVAKKTLLYTLVGAALLLGSFVVAQAIKGTVDDIKSTT